MERILPDSKKALYLGLLAIALILILTVRSVLGGLTLMLPVLLTLLWMLGAMKWLDIKINPFNLIAFPVALAFATLHSLHLFHRYEEEGIGSLEFVLKRTGKTAIVTSLVGSASFIPLIFAEHPGLSSLGITAILGFVFSLVAVLLVLPGVLGVWENRRVVREFIRPKSKA